MCRAPLLVGLLAVSAAACATEGVYRPTRFDVGASVTTADAEYPFVERADDNTVIVSTDESESTTAAGVNVLVTTHLATVGEGRTGRWSKVPVDLGLEWAVLWVPELKRPDARAPIIRAWLFTPRVSVRFPARNPTQLIAAVGGGAAWYTDGPEEDRKTTVTGVPSVTFGLRHLVTPHAGLRFDLGFTGATEPLWDGRNSTAWWVIGAGGFFSFGGLRR